MSIGVYVTGVSPLHRAPVGLKLLVLAVYAIAISLADSVFALCVAALVLGAAWAVSAVAWSRLLAALKPVVWLLAVLFVFQLIIASVAAAAGMVVTLSCLVGAAALVSHTTRTDDMLDTLTRAFSLFSRFGINPQACAFAVVFTVRLVPFIAAVGRDAIDARLARGASGNPLLALVPMVIRLMRESDILAEALVARGFGRA